MVAPANGSNLDPSFHSRRCLPVFPTVTSDTPSPGPLSGFNLGDLVERPHSVRPAPAPSVSAFLQVLMHLAPCHPLSPLSLCGRKPGSLFGLHPFMANQVKEKSPPLFYFSQVLYIVQAGLELAVETRMPLNLPFCSLHIPSVGIRGMLRCT